MTNEVFGKEEIENRLETEKLNELFSKIEVEDIEKSLQSLEINIS